MIERQELYCHDCGRYVQFDLDLELNGNHVLSCPNCNHEHCRVVENGRITGIRWDSRNRRVPVPTATVSSSSTSIYINMDAVGTSGDVFIYQAWANTVATG
jgi:uncharacterized protein YbaR (Trm112 family)